MPDIAMCNNKLCSKKETCYRYMATPNPYRQSYGMFNEKDCDMYMVIGIWNVGVSVRNVGWI